MFAVAFAGLDLVIQLRRLQRQQVLGVEARVGRRELTTERHQLGFRLAVVLL